MNHKIVVALFFTSLLISCADEKVEPEYPAISQAELDDFLSKETIFLNFTNTNWSFSIDDMQVSGINCFIHYPVQDTIALSSSLVNPDGRYFSLHADVVPFNDDTDVLTKHFSIGDKTLESCFDGYTISMNDPTRPNSILELHRIKVVKTSLSTQLYWNYERKIKVWFLLDFNIKDTDSGKVVEKIRNAKFITEFFVIDFSTEPLILGQTPYDKIIAPETIVE